MPGIVHQELCTLDDHDLLLGGVITTITEARAAADKLARLREYFRRREADHKQRYADNPHFALTPREHTVAEASELWAQDEAWLRRQLNIAICLQDKLPSVWELHSRGQLDAYRAGIVADQARHHLDRDEEYAALDRRLGRYLNRHLVELPELADHPELDGVTSVVRRTAKQLRNKLDYEIRLLRSSEAEERFRKAYDGRHVRASDGEDGISWLTIESTTDQVQLALHRLTLAAKQLRRDGDQRTLDQLKSDLAVQLLTGAGDDVPLPSYARPLINLTVPIQTVMGLSDEPGTLSGGAVVPAGLARMIAQQPGATWHRLLTDEAGDGVELSTQSYQPTRAIWQQVVAQWGSCFRPGCSTPATSAELDHRIPWPDGPTSTDNLWPACERDHKVKHAAGFTIEQTETGGFTINTPAGFSHPARPDEKPSSTQWPLVEKDFQYSATELVEALAFLRRNRKEQESDQPELLWEAGCDEALWSLGVAG